MSSKLTRLGQSLSMACLKKVLLARGWLAMLLFPAMVWKFLGWAVFAVELEAVDCRVCSSVFVGLLLFFANFLRRGLEACCYSVNTGLRDTTLACRLGS